MKALEDGVDYIKVFDSSDGCANQEPGNKEHADFLLPVKPLVGNEVEKVDGNRDEEKGVKFMLRVGRIPPSGTREPSDEEKKPSGELKHQRAYMAAEKAVCFLFPCSLLVGGVLFCFHGLLLVAVKGLSGKGNVIYDKTMRFRVPVQGLLGNIEPLSV